MGAACKVVSAAIGVPTAPRRLHHSRFTRSGGCLAHRRSKHLNQSPSLTLQRVGSFSAHAPVNRHQCGRQGLQNFSYSVAIKGGADTLDSQGFLIDNRAVQQYFDKTYSLNHTLKEVPSCEQIALKACEDFRTLVPKSKGVRVTISGSPQAKISAVWEPERLAA